MRKQLTYGLGVLVALILSAGAAVSVEGDGWKKFVCPEGPFSLELPPGWRSLDRIPDTIFAGAGAQEGPDDRFIENLTIATAPNSPPRTIEDFFELYLRYLPSVVDVYQFVSQGEVRIDGRVGRRLVFQQDLEGDPSTVMQFLFIKGDRVFILTFTDTPDTFDRRRADFERAALSLKFD